MTPTSEWNHQEFKKAGIFSAFYHEGTHCVFFEDEEGRELAEVYVGESPEDLLVMNRNKTDLKNGALEDFADWLAEEHWEKGTKVYFFN